MLCDDCMHKDKDGCLVYLSEVDDVSRCLAYIKNSKEPMGLCVSCKWIEDNGCRLGFNKNLNPVYDYCPGYQTNEYMKLGKDDDMKEKASGEEKVNVDDILKRHRKERERMNRKAWISEVLHISAVVLVWYTVGKKVGIRKGYKSGLEMGKIIGRESILTELLSK